jgi:hypothetical protein
MYAPLPTYEVRAYVGTREQYDGPVFGKKRVLDAVREFQLGPGNNVALVRVTECDYVAGDYWEGGFELAVLDYPRFPKGRSGSRTTCSGWEAPAAGTQPEPGRGRHPRALLPVRESRGGRGALVRRPRPPRERRVVRGVVFC